MSDRLRFIRWYVIMVDLHRDPQEMENLAGRPEHRQLQKRLTEQLEQWRSSHPEK